MRMYVFSARSYDTSALMRFAGDHELLFTEKRLSLETVHYASGYEAVSLFTSDDASGKVLEKLYEAGVRYLLLRSVGSDHVDLKKASLLGMRVANVPEYSPYSVAEHAVAMLMALNRKIIQGQALMSLQDFRIDSLKGFDIHGKNVGVIGTGKIGIAFSRIMLGFGAHVYAYDPCVSQEAIEIGIKYESLEGLLRKCDIVSLHCPLTSETRHLISGTQLSWMKQGAILINTARGAVINTNDLLMSLENGKLGGACLDVYEFEKGLFFEDHTADIIHDVTYARLRNFKNVLLTSHQGFLTEDAITQIAETTIGNLACFEKSLPCSNELGDLPGNSNNSRLQQLTLLSI